MSWNVAVVHNHVHKGLPLVLTLSQIWTQHQPSNPISLKAISVSSSHLCRDLEILQLTATSWTVWGLKPGGRKDLYLLHTCQDWPRDPSSYNGYWGSFPYVTYLILLDLNILIAYCKNKDTNSSLHSFCQGCSYFHLPRVQHFPQHPAL